MNCYIKNKSYLFIFLIFILVLISNTNLISASQVNSYDVKIDILSPNNAKIVENWKFDFNSESDLETFKEKILEININIPELKEIDSELEPHVYINDYKDVKITFDEVKKAVIIEYSIEDLCLIKYLDYEDEIFWKFNENLFRDFVTNNLYSIPKGSYLRVKLYDPLFFGETLPDAEIKNSVLSWTGISSNELKLIAIEKKPPKPTFVILDLYNNENLLDVFGYVILVLLIIIIVFLIFKKPISKLIKGFVISNSKIKTSKNLKEIVDSEYFEK
jgi:hypothetical protein